MGISTSAEAGGLPPSPPALRMVDVVKAFPGVLALDKVSFELRPGEIHALIGQNGAGKSTLMKILHGQYRATSGMIELAGRAVAIDSPRAAEQCGISIVHQELSLLPNLTVWQNIVLGRESKRDRLFLDDEEDLRRARAALDLLGAIDIDPHQQVARLGLAKQQLVEIARAISRRPRILILDEPTASLSRSETAGLFEVLRRLRAEGVGTIFITHRLGEIRELCDRGTVLRNGRVVATVDIATTTEAELIALMLGEGLTAPKSEAARRPAAGGGALELREVVAAPALRGITLSVDRGEIYGLTGLLGAGQNAVARLLFGVISPDSGSIHWRGQSLSVASPRAAVRRRIAFLAEDRRGEGVFPNLNVKENLTLAAIGRFRLYPIAGLLSLVRERRAARDMMDRLRIVARGESASVVSLSGGNQQKVLLGRWLLNEADLLVLEEPTHGVDVGAKAEIHGMLRELAREGRTILVVGSDVGEMLRFCDRIGAMYKGRLIAEYRTDGLSEDTVHAAVQGMVSG